MSKVCLDIWDGKCGGKGEGGLKGIIKDIAEITKTQEITETTSPVPSPSPLFGLFENKNLLLILIIGFGFFFILQMRK